MEDHSRTLVSNEIQPGMRFGSLIVVEPAQKSPWGKRQWHCQCDCEKITVAEATGLVRGKRVSCGCSKTAPRPYRVIHAMCGSRLYSVWSNMKNRCLNPNASNYQWYGGRGIRLCQAWMHFDNFMKWALANGYSDALELDRTDNDGSYSPENCRWITHKEQCKNRRTCARKEYEHG